MRLCAFQPDIAPNLGTIIRTCACLDVPLDVVEPCGFPFSVKQLRRAAMDYADIADITRHNDWESFQKSQIGARRVLLTTKGADSLWDFTFQPDDILILGRESAGVPDDVHNACDARVTIPMNANTRSLNVAISGAMALSEAIRQTRS